MTNNLKTAALWIPCLLLLGTGIVPGNVMAAPQTSPQVLPTGLPTTIRGEVVDTGCYVIGNRHGARHRQCAIACARSGQDLGVLEEETGLLYVEIRDQQDRAVRSQLLPFVARQVEVRGDPHIQGGLRGMRINRVRGLD